MRYKTLKFQWPWLWPSRSLKVKCDSAIELPIHGFLLMVNSNIRPSMAPLWDIRLWNLGDLDFDLSRSPRVKPNGAVGISTYGFLLMFDSNHMSISHRLGNICTWKFSPYLLSLGQNSPTPTRPSYPRPIFLNIEPLHPWVTGKAPTKYKVDCLNTFCVMLLTDRHTQTDRQTHTHIHTKRSQ